MKFDELAIGIADFWLTPRRFTDQALCVEIGDLSLLINRQPHEWRLHYEWRRKGEGGAFSCRFEVTCESGQNNLERIVMESMPDTVTLLPMLADRPIVVRPYAPLTIPGNNSVTLYVGTPLWLGVDFSGQARKELPVQLLSDTWMGSLTGRGELCYGSHTHARLDMALLPKLPYRVSTPVTIRNKGRDSMKLERLSIPAAHLSLYLNDEGLLVTEPLSIVMEAETHQGIVEIGKAAAGKVFTPPREYADKGILVKTWENLFA